MATLSDADERSLHDGLDKVAELVSSGMLPDDAMAKTARELGWLPGFVRSAVSAYNTGRQLSQWRRGGDVLEKLSGFPLASFEKVRDRIWGGEKQASADPFATALAALPPEIRPTVDARPLAPLTKQAEAVEPPHVVEHRRVRERDLALARLERAKQACDAAGLRRSQLLDRVHAGLDGLRRYFSKSAFDRDVTFADFEGVVRLRYGAAGRELAEYLAQRLPGEKRAGDRWIQRDAAVEQAPYEAAERLVAAARALTVENSKTAAFEAERAAAEAALDPFAEKSADMGSWAGGAAVASGTRALMERMLAPDEKERQVARTQQNLEDPLHESELRSIRARAMLTELLSDPQDPISGFDPDEVLHAYNQIVGLSPHLATQPAAMRPVLSKQLLGRTEPFEARQLVDLNNAVARGGDRPYSPELSLA